MEVKTYDKAKTLRTRIVELEDRLAILKNEMVQPQEVDLTIVLNNYNSTIKLNNEEIEGVIALLQDELDSKKEEFENL